MLPLSDVLALAGTQSRYRRGPRPAGFLAGLWHGIVLLVAFVIGAFDPTLEHSIQVGFAFNLKEDIAAADKEHSGKRQRGTQRPALGRRLLLHEGWRESRPVRQSSRSARGRRATARQVWSDR
jgi:hypothetical protein